MSDPIDNQEAGQPLAGGIWQFLWKHGDFPLIELKILVITFAILYVSAHATLHRPPSAQPRKKGAKTALDDDENEEDDEEPSNIGGLQPSDAIVFPIMASIALVGMYYVIQYLRSAEILNMVMRCYTSVVSVGSLITLYSHGLQLATSIIFPRYWRARNGTIYFVDQATRRHYVWEEDKPIKDQEGLNMPLGPLPCSVAALCLPLQTRASLWELRGLLTEKWILEIKLHGILNEKMPLRFSHGLAALMSVATIIAYNFTNSALLSNIMGLAFCYATQQLLSPTTFVTGSLVLVGLFFYDIVMVFYTPFMLTVATQVDAPVKLTIKTGSRSNLLGLGDIVIPGIMVALSLRFDLWMHYQRKVRYVPADVMTNSETSKGSQSSQLIRPGHLRSVAKREQYSEVMGTWGDWLWTSSFLAPFRSYPRPPSVHSASFPKPYFYASLTGYALGMGFTMTMLMVFKHGQPALLYLVPGLIGALLLTGFVRGEIREMLVYNEDGSLDVEDVEVELDKNGRLFRFILPEQTEESKKEVDEGGESRSNKQKTKEVSTMGKSTGIEAGVIGGRQRSDVLLIRISAPIPEVDENAPSKLDEL
ncbi:hypothetical protein jhhlp_000549 [Lomentospora prolificans]|uniref:Signal peptide peptidase n=1 Tax=Lomentospora prolificans TaxID=41688 RepID=A0A2N3NL96_9PEZI|nr:hypothetical protein jhhlp_000549 [Lomentospora prolificans]